MYTVIIVRFYVNLFIRAQLCIEQNKTVCLYGRIPLLILVLPDLYRYLFTNVCIHFLRYIYTASPAFGCTGVAT